MKSSPVSRAFSVFSILLATAHLCAAAETTSADNTVAAPAVTTTAIPPTVYNVRAYGAVGDGKVLDTDAVNRAINAAAAAGGGTVYFPAGYYLCYSIHLKTNITLYLDQGSWIVADEPPAVVLTAQSRRGNRGGNGGGAGGGAGAANAAGTSTSSGTGTGAAGAVGTGGTGLRTTAPVVTRSGGPAPAVAGAAGTTPAATTNAAGLTPEQFQAQQSQQTQLDLAVQVPTGTPMYDAPENNQWTNAGRAGEFQDFGHSHWQNSLMWGDNITNVSILGPGIIYGRGLTRDESRVAGSGNKAISLKNCRNVILKDFTILQGGWFGLLATGVDNFTINNVKVDTNRDGFDIDCCKNVRISDCMVNSPRDDGIVLKSSYALGYARSTDNVSITNCQVSGYVLGTFLDGTYDASNGAATGPDRSGATGRIKFGTESNGGFKNISISNCVFIHCRGLALETVDGGIIEDITVNNISMQDIVNSPIFIRLGHRLRGPADTTVIGAIRRVKISNVVASGVYNQGGIIIAGTIGTPIQDVELSNIRIDYNGKGTAAQADIDPPEDEQQDYPEPGRLGTIPSYGLFVRHVNGLVLRDVEFSYADPDLRPPVILDDVSNVQFDHFKAEHADGLPLFMMWNVRDFDSERTTGLPDMHIAKIDEGTEPVMPKPAAAPAATAAPATTASP